MEKSVKQCDRPCGEYRWRPRCKGGAGRGLSKQSEAAHAVRSMPHFSIAVRGTGLRPDAFQLDYFCATCENDHARRITAR